ncbi:hypothetical protein [Pedobacter puniceum]|uniref:Uncharacterized protein n=1 Tax=Pedobacter puniceum TaxID=2666136 RepID=A0A7K0FLZ0_9SPHI|nr:hypothetical protein [Pedobacter puniceum]MRX46943.1 hypothetical protein [Pedobacter puniceum]
MEIESLAQALLHSKESLESQKIEFYKLEKELEDLKKREKSSDMKLRILQKQSEVNANKTSVDNRIDEKKEIEAELLEKLKEAEIKIDELIEFHLQNESYFSVEYNIENEVIIRGPYSKI